MAQDRRDVIRQTAYSIWERSGRPFGMHDQHWAEAEESAPFTKFEEQLAEEAKKLRGRIGYCAKHAYRHLQLAWKLRRIDPEMAVLRAITSEEEAATGLLLALQQKRYDGAAKLNPRDHLHKNAVFPFCSAVSDVLKLMQFSNPRIILRKYRSTPRIDIAIQVLADYQEGGPLDANPDEPLNFMINAVTPGRVAMETFTDNLRKIANDAGIAELSRYLKNEANVRNELLYASDTGMPQVTVTDEFFFQRMLRVSVINALTVCIQQTPIKQLFASQCLQAFLLALGRIEAVCVPEMPPPAQGPEIQIRKAGSAAPEVRLVTRYSASNVGQVYSQAVQYVTVNFSRRISGHLRSARRRAESSLDT